ncbi:MAG: DUF2341 domain-containing protein [Clostridia bacterium]|nr:DUF2341 domain-containing protein [Clostridia bacterium]
MKKTLSIVLCFCMLFGLSAFSISAETTESDKHCIAYLAETKPVIDGTVTASNSYLNTSLSSADSKVCAFLGFLWDADALYLSATYQNADLLTFTAGSETIQYHLSQNAFIQNDIGATGTAMPDLGHAEFILPFDAMHIRLTEFQQKIPYSIIISDSETNTTVSESGNILLTGSKIITADNCNNFSVSGLGNGIAYLPNQATANSVITQGSTPDDTGYRFETVTPETPNVIRSYRKNLSDYSGGAVDISMDVDFINLPVVTANYGWRGFAQQLRTADGQVRGFAFYKTTDDSVYCGITTSSSINETFDTGIDIGSGRHIIKLSISEENVPTLYVDNQKVHTYSAINHKVANVNANTWDIMLANYDRSGTDAVSVDLYDIAFTKPLYEDNKAVLSTLMEQITFDTIKGANTSEDTVFSDLSLPKQVTVPFIQIPLSLQWLSSDTSVMSNEGIITESATSKLVTLTVRATLGGFTMEKEFPLNITIYDENGTIGIRKHDLDPYTGSLSDFSISDTCILDDDYTSIGIDLKEAQKINRLILTDADDVSRVEKRNLSLYISNDNITYTRVKDWSFFKAGKEYYLYHFEETARYFKVHCHYETLDGTASFIAPRQSMLRAYFAETDDFIGANGFPFRYVTPYTISNRENTELYDYAAFIPTEKLGFAAGSTRKDMADVRFTLNQDANAMLYHYYDGTGFYVRIPHIGAHETQKLYVHYGNAEATSVSNGNGTFEVEYGNKTLQDVAHQPTFVCNAKVQKMPNGDLISVANNPSYSQSIYLRRSTDGGRTWGEPTPIVTDALPTGRNEGGSFIEDGNRIFFIYYQYRGFVDNDVSKSDCKMAMIYTDDSGYNWSAPAIIHTGHSYSLTYSNGIVTSVKDGDGPNVDYVIPYGLQYDSTGSFATTTIYSKDCGKTWQSSESVIRIDALGTEGGVSESSVAELSDGRLLMLMRCQVAGVVNFYQSFSSDYGVTWDTSPTVSGVVAVNTLPVLRKDRENLMLLWSGHNLLGANTYLRFPLTAAYSEDDGKTWKQHLDLLSGTSWSYATWEHDLITQTDITYSDYRGGDDAVVMWWYNNWNGPHTSRSVLIEDYHDYLYKTQGAYDGFEGSSAKFEGWHNAQIKSYGQTAVSPSENVENKEESAGSENRALKLQDSAGAIVRGSRNIPSMTKGTVSADIYIPSGHVSGVYAELKTAYNTLHYTGTPIAFYITKDGTVSVRDGSVGRSTSKVVSANEWHNFRVEFDMETVKKAKLYVDNEFVTEFAVNMSAGAYISCLQFSDGSSNNAANEQSYFLLDNVIATKTIRDASLITITREYDISYQKSDKTIAVSVPEDTSATAIVAAYHGNELLDMIPFTKDFGANATEIIDASSLATDGATKIKVMLFSDLNTIKPYCKSKEIPLN